MSDAGAILLQALAERVLVRYLEATGLGPVDRVGRSSGGSNTVDLTYSSAGGVVRVKVKPDTYFGQDAVLLKDRSLTFYRPEGTTLAFEVISDARTREPGWALRSDADELFYYSLVIPQREQVIAGLMEERDEVFFSGLAVERDELRIIPMKEFREWFGRVWEEYPSRPVVTGEHSAWYRLVPKADVERAIAGARKVSPVFSTLTGA